MELDIFTRFFIWLGRIIETYFSYDYEDYDRFADPEEREEWKNRLPLSKMWPTST